MRRFLLIETQYLIPSGTMKLPYNKHSNSVIHSVFAALPITIEVPSNYLMLPIEYPFNYLTLPIEKPSTT